MANTKPRTLEHTFPFEWWRQFHKAAKAEGKTPRKFLAMIISMGWEVWKDTRHQTGEG